MSFVRTEKKDKYAVLTIDRTDAMNALNEDVLKDMRDAVESLNSDPGIQVMIITGAGDKAFCAGADIAQMVEFGPDQAEAFARRGHKTMNTIQNSDIISIAAINGFALGGGLELALSCDIRIASDNAKMGLPETGLGLIPGFGGTQRLARLVGRSAALEIILTGSMVDANRALQTGLVNAVLEPGELLAEAEKMASKMIQHKGPEAQRVARWLVNSGLDQPLSAGLEREINSFSEIFEKDEPKTGLKAYLAKEKPDFHK